MPPPPNNSILKKSMQGSPNSSSLNNNKTTPKGTSISAPAIPAAGASQSRVSFQLDNSTNNNNNNNNHGNDEPDSLSGTSSLSKAKLTDLEAERPEPPPPRLYRTVKVFHLNKWTRRFAILIFISALLSVFVPQFLAYVPKSHTFGLFQECEGMACLPANFTVLQVHPGCKANCNDESKFLARFNAISALYWLGAFCAMILGTVQYLHYGRAYIVPLNGILIPTIVTFILGTFFLVAGLAVFGSTLDIGYEGSACTFSQGCFVYGTASYIAVFALIFFFLSGASGIVAGLFHRRRLGLKFEFFEGVLKHLPVEAIELGASMVKRSEEQQQKNKLKEDESADDEEMTDLVAQPTAAFGEDAETQALNKSKKALHEDIAATAALVSQESHFYAGEKDGDFDQDEDDDTDDSDLDEDEKAERAERKRNKNNNNGITTAAPSPDKSVKYQATTSFSNNNNNSTNNASKSVKLQQEEEELAKTRSLLKEAVGDLKVNVRSARGWQRVFNQGAIFFAALACGFAVGAVLSPKWLYISPTGMSSALNRFSVGLLAECDDNSCTTVKHEALLINNTCGHDTDTLRARLGISAVFYLAAAIFAVPLYFTSSKSCTSLLGQRKRKIFSGIVFGLCFFAVIISMHTFDSWINCDIPWCEAFLSTNTAGSCEYGFMFGTALMCIILSFGLVMMNIIQSVCRPCGYEEKRKSVLDAAEDKKKAEDEQKKYAFTNTSSANLAASSGSQKPSHQPIDDDDEADDSSAPPHVAETPRDPIITVG